MPNDSGQDTPHASVGVVRPANHVALDLALESIKRLSNLSLGDPEVVTGETKFTAKPGRLHYVDTSSGDVHCYLSGVGGKAGQACTVVNSGRQLNSYSAGVVYVHPPQGSTIDGWPTFPLLYLGSAATFINISKNRFTCIATPQKMNWPQLYVSVGDDTKLYAQRYVGSPPTLALRMSDGRICTASGTSSTVFGDVAAEGLGGVVGGSASTVGLYHVYAVPHNTQSNKFNLILQLGDGSFTWPVDPTTRDTVAPTGYSVYKYLGSWRALDMSGTTKFPSFHTDINGWFLSRNWVYFGLVSGTTFTPAAATWYDVDGTTYVTTLTTVSPFTLYPKYATRALSLHASLLQTTGQTSAQSAYVAGGDSGSPPWTITDSAVQKVQSMPASAVARSAHNSFIMPVGVEGVIVGFLNNVEVGNFTLGFRGYQNILYGVD